MIQSALFWLLWDFTANAGIFFGKSLVLLADMIAAWDGQKPYRRMGRL